MTCLLEVGGERLRVYDVQWKAWIFAGGVQKSEVMAESHFAHTFLHINGTPHVTALEIEHSMAHS